MTPMETTIFPSFCLRVNQRRTRPVSSISKQSGTGKKRGDIIFFSKNKFSLSGICYWLSAICNHSTTNCSSLVYVFILPILPALWNTKSIPLGRLFVYPMKCLFLFYFIGAAINPLPLLSNRYLQSRIYQS